MKGKIIFFILVGILAISASSVMAQPQTPRHETLIVDILAGRTANPHQWNPYVPGVNPIQGAMQLIWDRLWEINTIKGEQINSLASKPPKALNKNYTKWRIYLREGIYWSDGIEFTAEDVVFTFKMLANTEKLPLYNYWNTLLENVKVVDRYTVDLQLKKSYPKIQETLGVVIGRSYFLIVPKHVWEDKNPMKFTNYPPVSIGPYALADIDEKGYWFLYKRRQDWERTSVGQLYGKPSPKYILFKYYGPEIKRVMAGVQHKLDIFCDISPESWEILREKNKYAKAWYDKFPWATFNDAGNRGIFFNCSKFPYNLEEVRWALALATDIKKVSLGTFSGMLRFSPLHIAPTNLYTKIYLKPLEPWLREFELPDGYKPFDPNVSVEMGKYLRNSGEEAIPENEKSLKDIFSIGWWNYEPSEATKLLKNVGFKRDSKGNWLLPNGEPWRMTIICPSFGEIESKRLAFSVANQWKKFGVDVNVHPVEASTFFTKWAMGSFQAHSWLSGAGFLPDIWPQINFFHEQYIVSTGKATSSNIMRWENSKINELADKMGKLLPADPKGIELGKEALKVLVKKMPWIPMFGTSKFVPTDSYYWKNYPSATHPYLGPWWWYSNFKFMLSHLEPTGRK